AGGGGRGGEGAGGGGAGGRAGEWVRPGLVDRAQLLRIALDKFAGQGEVRVHSDEHAARVGPAAEGAPDDNETLGVLRSDRVEQLVPAGPAGLPVSPDQRDSASVLAGRAQRRRQQPRDVRRIGTVLNCEQIA